MFKRFYHSVAVVMRLLENGSHMFMIIFRKVFPVTDFLLCCLFLYVDIKMHFMYRPTDELVSPALQTSYIYTRRRQRRVLLIEEERFIRQLRVGTAFCGVRFSESCRLVRRLLCIKQAICSRFARRNSRKLFIMCGEDPYNIIVV